MSICKKTAVLFGCCLPEFLTMCFALNHMDYESKWGCGKEDYWTADCLDNDKFASCQNLLMLFQLVLFGSRYMPSEFRLFSDYVSI